jgi:hypothetical protein
MFREFSVPEIPREARGRAKRNEAEQKARRNIFANPPGLGPFMRNMKKVRAVLFMDSSA